MKKFRILILSALIIISSSFMLSLMAFAKEYGDQEKLENAKKYVIGTNLGMVAMMYSNITEDDAQEIGFHCYETYEKTGKSNQVIRVWLMNSSEKVISVNPLNFKVITEKEYTIPLSNYTFRTRNPFPSTSLEPHTKIDGFIVFELVMKDSILKIIYDDGMGSRVEREYGDAVILGFYERELKKHKLSK